MGGITSYIEMKITNLSTINNNLPLAQRPIYHSFHGCQYTSEMWTYPQAKQDLYSAMVAFFSPQLLT